MRRGLAGWSLVGVGIIASFAAPQANAGTVTADEFIRTQCKDVSYTTPTWRKVRFCDKQHYVTTTGQRKHVVTATQLSNIGTGWRFKLATANRSVSNSGPIGTYSSTLTITDSWSSSLSAKSVIYINSSWDMPYAYALFRM